MSPLLILAVTAVMVGTAFLSGIFGMAGGLILIGILLVLLPLPEAMALHAVTQMASNGWRGLLWWRHVRWRTVGVYLIGCLIALVAWSLWRYVPSKPVALIGLGITPFLVRLLPAGLKPNPDSAPQTVIYGVLLHHADAADRRVRTDLRLVLPRRQSRPARDRRHQVGLPAVRPRHEARLLHGAGGSGRRHRSDRRRHSRSPPRCSAPRWPGRCWKCSPTTSTGSGRRG